MKSVSSLSVAPAASEWSVNIPEAPAKPERSVSTVWTNSDSLAPTNDAIRMVLRMSRVNAQRGTAPIERPSQQPVEPETTQPTESKLRKIARATLMGLGMLIAVPGALAAALSVIAIGPIGLAIAVGAFVVGGAILGVACKV